MDHESNPHSSPTNDQEEHVPIVNHHPSPVHPEEEGGGKNLIRAARKIFSVMWKAIVALILTIFGLLVIIFGICLINK